ncbi:uncharacterized protein Z518_08392 [Rhinocladiella mackenziei CBS 650.93]|uniref:Major facilitator superfamily (MFS) profile domain-containing protein n=1 Tax=Rhinocladiella mackenziei CBS 650.93 TaxID=1442369 RepID=A0A0D2IGQ2_9EURO|nr:uncharacterized protein Z518_08392 [Rhinocladiella mackenziei CBS 650.93]KIX02451.1 hypothetical protein Z518_08392 [Rhinocladiella mackenziei CBS 650.93]
MESKATSPRVESLLPSPAIPTVSTSADTNMAEPSTAKESEDTEYLGPRALSLLVGALLLAILIVILDTSILATAIPQITDHFHTISDIGWYVAAYMLTNASLQPLTGKFYTYFSLKYAFVGFLAVFELGSLICALATSSSMLVIGRAVSGIGASGLQNGALTIIGIAAPPSQQPPLFGILMSFAGAGQLIGPLIGGALTEHASWRWCFWINLPIGGVTILTMIFIPFPPYRARKTNWTFRDVTRDFDIPGFALFAPACIMLLLALEWGGVEYSWSSATIIGLLCGGGGVFLVFLIWEYFHDGSAMIPLSLIRQRVIYSSMLTAAIQFGGLLIFTYYMPLWFQVIKGASPTLSAVYILPTFVTQILSAIAVGVIVSRVGYLMPPAFIGSAFATVSAGLMSTFTTHTGTGTWIGYQILNGVGRGISLQQPIQAVQSVASSDLMPTATAMVAWAQNFGGTIVIGVAQTAFLNILQNALNTHARGVDASEVTAAGATNYLASLAGDDNADLRNNVLISYNQAITQTFYIAVGCAAVSCFTILGIGRTRIERKKKRTEITGKDEEKGVEKKTNETGSNNNDKGDENSGTLTTAEPNLRRSVSKSSSSREP